MASRGQTQLDAGRLLAALGGLLLLVSLFLDWYGDGFGEAISGWNSFELLDVLLAALALLAIYAAAEGLASRDRWPTVPPSLAAAGGPLALLLVVVSIIDKPPVLLFTDDPQLEAGVWVALAAALAMTAGTALSRVRISFVVSPRRDDRDAAREPGATNESTAEPAESAAPAAETRVMPREENPPSSSPGL